MCGALWLTCKIETTAPTEAPDPTGSGASVGAVVLPASGGTTTSTAGRVCVVIVYCRISNAGVGYHHQGQPSRTSYATFLAVV